MNFKIKNISVILLFVAYFIFVNRTVHCYFSSEETTDDVIPFVEDDVSKSIENGNDNKLQQLKEKMEELIRGIDEMRTKFPGLFQEIQDRFINGSRALKGMSGLLLPPECIRAIKERDFQKACRMLDLIDDPNDRASIVRQVFQNNRWSFGVILDFAETLQQEDAFFFYKELHDAASETGFTNAEDYERLAGGLNNVTRTSDEWRTLKVAVMKTIVHPFVISCKQSMRNCDPAFLERMYGLDNDYALSLVSAVTAHHYMHYNPPCRIPGYQILEMRSQAVRALLKVAETKGILFGGTSCFDEIRNYIAETRENPGQYEESADNTLDDMERQLTSLGLIFGTERGANPNDNGAFW